MGLQRQDLHELTHSFTLRARCGIAMKYELAYVWHAILYIVMMTKFFSFWERRALEKSFIDDVMPFPKRALESGNGETRSGNGTFPKRFPVSCNYDMHSKRNSTESDSSSDTASCPHRYKHNVCTAHARNYHALHIALQS